MVSKIGKETEFMVPAWSAKKARHILEAWNHDGITIEYKEENYIILILFIVTIWGAAHKVNQVTELIKQQFKEL